MPDASAIRAEPHVQIREIAVVDERPVVVAATDDAHQAVRRVLEQVADDAARPAVDDARADDDGPDAGGRGVEHARLVRRAPGDELHWD